MRTLVNTEMIFRERNTIYLKTIACFCLFVFIGLNFYISVKSYGHVETVSSPKQTFSWTSGLNQYFVHILLLVTDITTLLESVEGGE